jgi:exonuclease V gamma subunit
MEKSADGGTGMKQIERITYMEQILDEATEAVSSLSEALEKYSAIQDNLQALTTYYSSKQWRQDFDDDSAGKIPKDLKRGVLSEDAVYNLLADVTRLEDRMKNLTIQ